VECSVPPESMSPKQRLEDIAALLARGIARARVAKVARQLGTDPESRQRATKPLDPVAKTRLSGARG